LKIGLNIFLIFLLTISLILNFLPYIGSSYLPSYAQESNNDFSEFRQREFTDEPLTPEISDSNLHIEEVATGLELPTTMAFLSPNDILVLEKEKGTVQRIIDGQIQPEPLLDVNVAGAVERCMCGIAISKNTPGHVFVFLYYTEAESADRDDMTDGKAPLGNRLYRYELVNNKLVDPKLLLDLPATPGPRHNGGAIKIGPDNNLYVTIGDVDGHETQSQNQRDGLPDMTSGILRITQEGNPVSGDSILGDESPLNMYYAYGIRNSYGIDFDPVTGNLWDTENGPGYGDEINLVEPGFDSGWTKVQGIWLRGGVDTEAPPSESEAAPLNPENLVDFDGKGVYRTPEFIWWHTVGPTAVQFLHSDKLGAQYQNDMFVGDVHNGYLYRFKLNEDRTQLLLTGELEDKLADTDEELTEDTGVDGEGIVFGQGFGGITDLQVGPDGYLYVVSIGQGKIFKIVPGDYDADTPTNLNNEDGESMQDNNNNNNDNDN
jgi:glucose/arabinose dehydrogenase